MLALPGEPLSPWGDTFEFRGFLFSVFFILGGRVPWSSCLLGAPSHGPQAPVSVLPRGIQAKNVGRCASTGQPLTMAPKGYRSPPRGKISHAGPHQAMQSLQRIRATWRCLFVMLRCIKNPGAGGTTPYFPTYFSYSPTLPYFTYSTLPTAPG